MSIRFFTALCLLFFTVFFMNGPCFADVSENYRRVRQEYDLLLASQQKQLYRDNWQRVIDGFDRFAAQHPTHERAPAALYLAGRATQRLYAISRRASDNEAAIKFYQRLALHHPASNLADDALVLAAAALETHANRPTEAYWLFRQVVERYPDGDMIGQARQGVRRLAAHAPAQQTQTGPPALVASSALSTPTPPSTRTAEQARLLTIRHWASPDYTRVVLELSRSVAFRTGSLPGDSAAGLSSRIYIDLPETLLDGETGSTQVYEEGLLRRIRSARQADGSSRVVLDLAVASDYKAFALKDPDRIVIDLAGVKQQLRAPAPAEIRSSPPSQEDPIAQVLGSQAEEPVERVRIAETASNRLRRIVVDPGHGGKDPGAIGQRGTMEKDVNLALAQELARRLRREFDCEVILTRDRDVYLPLEERTAIANRVGADLFISIHANASPNHSVRGVETYYLNFSSSERAAAVAARENGTSLQQISDLEMILFDLMANAKINESSRLAAEVQSSMVTTLQRYFPEVKDNGVRQGPFYVLLGATMPSVLVEAGYLSNAQDENLLRTRRYQERVAEAIVAGVKKFARDSRMIANR